jgi:ADP-heptose:LPS heptosyltransferase
MIVIKRNIDALGDTIMMSIIVNTYAKENPDKEIIIAIDSKKEYIDIFLSNFVDKVINYNDTYFNHSLLLDNSSVEKCDLSSESSVYEDSGIYIDRIELSLKILNCTANNVIKKKPNVKDNNKIPTVDIFIHCDSNDEKRRFNGWYNIIDYFFDKGLNIAYSFGNRCYFKVQKNFSNRSNFNSYSEEISLNDLVCMINKCKLFLGCDSGLMHVAGLLDKESLCLFGSTIPETRLKYYPKTKSILSKVSCVGCYNKDCVYDIRCMKEITYQEVIKNIESEFYEILF